MFNFALDDEPGMPQRLREMLEQLSAVAMTMPARQKTERPETVEALKMALTEDGLELSASLAHEVGRLDVMLDQGVKAHPCGYPNCIVTELLQLRMSQRVRTGYTPVFRITEGKWAEPGAPEREGFTRFQKENYPRWLVEWVRAWGKNPNIMPMIDIQFVGKLPEDSVGYDFSNDPNDPSRQPRRVVEIDFERACFEHLLTVALTDDTAQITDQGVLRATANLDTSIDLEEPHICSDPACRFEEYRQLRLAQRKRVGFVPEFHVARISTVDDPGQEIPVGYTRYAVSELPVWLQIYIAKNDTDPDDLASMDIIALDVMTVGVPPDDDDPSNFYVISVWDVHNLDSDAKAGYTRYIGPNYPTWLVDEIMKEVGGNPVDLSSYLALDVKTIGTPPV